jgi:hypothetical protein
VFDVSSVGRKSWSSICFTHYSYQEVSRSHRPNKSYALR